MFYVPKKNNNIILEWHLLSTLAVLEQVYLIVIIFRLFIPATSTNDSNLQLKAKLNQIRLNCHDVLCFHHMNQ